MLVFLRMCIFCCTSDTAYWKQFLSRYARTNFPIFPRSYVRTMQPILQTLTFFFENTVGTSCNTFHSPPVSKLTMGSEIALPIDKSIFFQKKCLFSCVCAFFVVPLRAFLRVCALMRMRRVWFAREKSKK